MNLKTFGAIRMFSVALGFVLISGCPPQSEKNVAWLINSTDDTTFTAFWYTKGAVDMEINLATPLTPKTAQRFEYDDATRDSITSVGLRVSGGFGILSPTNGTFGFGGTDFVMCTQVSNAFQGRYIKSPD